MSQIASAVAAAHVATAGIQLRYSKAFHIMHDKAFKDKAFLAALDDVPPRAAVNTLASDRRTSGDRVGSRTKYSVMDVVPLRSAGVAT